MDDLNYLLKREQEELLHAQNAHCPTARGAHYGLAKRFARRVRQHPLPYRSARRDGIIPFDPHPFGGEGEAI